MLVNNTLLLLLFAAIAFLVVWSLNRYMHTKKLLSLWTSVNSAISSFDALNRPDRDFTKEELDGWIKLYITIFEDSVNLNPEGLSPKYDQLKKSLYEFQETFKNAPEIQEEHEKNRFAIIYVNAELDNFVDYQNTIFSDRSYNLRNFIYQYEAKCSEFLHYLDYLNKKGLLKYLKNSDKATEFLHKDEHLLKLMR